MIAMWLSLWVAGATAAGPWPELEPPVLAARDGAGDAALIIAVENYDQLDDIPGARLNAEAWNEWFVKSRGVPLENVVVVLDAAATREKVLSAVDATARKVGPGGSLWLIFIGHGLPTPDQTARLVGADARGTPESLGARSVGLPELAARLPPGMKSVVALDSCFSGRTWGGGALSAEPLAPVVPVEALAPGGMSVVAAAEGSEYAGPLPGVPRPGFSYLLLGALEGWADDDGDGRVSLRQAVEYSRAAMAVTVQGRTQTPNVWSGSADLEVTTGRKGSAPDLFAIARELRGGGPDPAMMARSSASNPAASPARQPRPATAVAGGLLALAGAAGLAVGQGLVTDLRGDVTGGRVLLESRAEARLRVADTLSIGGITLLGSGVATLGVGLYGRPIDAGVEVTWSGRF